MERGRATAEGTGSGAEVVTELSDSMEEPVQFAKLIRCLLANQPGKPQPSEFSMQNVYDLASFVNDALLYCPIKGLENCEGYIVILGIEF